MENLGDTLGILYALLSEIYPDVDVPRRFLSQIETICDREDKLIQPGMDLE